MNRLKGGSNKGTRSDPRKYIDRTDEVREIGWLRATSGPLLKGETYALRE